MTENWIELRTKAGGLRVNLFKLESDLETTKKEVQFLEAQMQLKETHMSLLELRRRAVEEEITQLLLQMDAMELQNEDDKKARKGIITSLLLESVSH